MATTVDTLLVRIEADMSDLRRDIERATRAVETQTGSMSRAFAKVGRAIAAIGGAYAFGSFIKETISTGAQVEGLKVQLDALLGSAEEGGKAFDKMAEFAARVPFSLQDIQSASGSLAAASKNADQLGELLQVTGNIASQFNIPFDQAAENVQRSLSAGAASADLFQQKGVNAFMGFEAGVSYSASETAKKLIEYFGTGGKSDGAMDNFAKTTGGALSMFGDAMFGIRKTIAESGLNEGFVELVNVITDMLKGSTGLAQSIGEVLGGAFSSLAKAMRFVQAISGEIIAVFGSIINIVTILTGYVMAAFGPVVQAAMSAVGTALAVIKQNFDLVVLVTAAWLTYNIGATFLSTAHSALSLAKSLRGLGMTQKIVNVIARKGLGPWILIGGIFGAITGLTDDLAEKIGDIAQKAYDMLPKELRDGFGDLAEDFTAAGAAIEEATKSLTYNPLKIDIDEGIVGPDEIAAATAAIQAALASQGGSAAAASKEFDKLKTSIEGLQPEKDKLKEKIDAITDALPKMSGKLREQAEVAIAILKQQLRELNPMYTTLKDATISFSQSVASSFADALVEGKDAMEGLKNAFKSFVKQMIAKALELYVFNHIINAVFGLSGSAALPTASLLKRASGGSLQPGVPTVVGERGPELIVPSSAGTIMNAHNTRNAGGGAPVVINQSINVSAGVAQTVRAEMMNMLPSFKESAMQGVLDAKRRGGSFGQAFG
jgi:hypothetical protein